MKLRSLVLLAVPSALAFSVFSCVGDDPGATGERSGSVSEGGAGGGDSSDGTRSDARTDTDVPDGGDGDRDGSADSAPPPHVPITDSYFKSTNPHVSAGFGDSVAISADGNTIAVGSPGEDSAATGVNNTNPGPGDTSADSAGAVFVFTKSASGVWSQQAYIKPNNTAALHRFGRSISMSSDGNRLAVGAQAEDTTATNSGAVYIFQRSGSNWAQIPGAPIKAANAMASAEFGSAVALSGDGLLLAVAAFNESSSDSGISTGNGGAYTGPSTFRGAVYLFTYGVGGWTQTHYIKPSIMRDGARFGWSVALSGSSTGTVLAVGAIGDSSNATGVSGSASADTSAAFAGAGYIFEKNGASWVQAAYVKPSNTRPNARFGQSVSLSADGQTLVVGSDYETSGATGVNNTNPGPDDTTAGNSGAAYVFTKNAGTWAQTAYIKASNTRSNAYFGRSVDLSVDGKSLIVGSNAESSGATGVNNTNPGQGDTSISAAGAAYVFALVDGAWTQTGYLKPFTSAVYSSNFGASVGITNGAAAVVVGASTEPTNNTGIDGTSTTTNLGGSGAAFTFK